MPKTILTNEQKDRKKAYHREWRKKNRHKRNATQRKYRKKNMDKESAYHREWAKKNRDKRNAYKREWAKKNRDKVNAYDREWAKKNRDKRNVYCRKIRKQRPEIRIIQNQRTRLGQFVKSCSIRSSERFGCTPKQLREHIEAQFKRGMTWQNYGKWHIDHIMPCSAFDLTNPDHVKICFNWQNLRPLWAKQNASKGKKITHPQFNLPLVK